MPKRPQEEAMSSFDLLLTEKLIAMGARRQLRFLNQATVDGSQRSKEPDSSYLPYTLPVGRLRHWPSVTVEVCYSEKKLTEDAKWWLNDSRGDVRLVIIINIHRGKQRKIDVQRWELAPPTYSTRSNTGRTGPKVVEQVRVSEQRGVGNQLNFNVNGGSITVPFECAFLRGPSNPAEGDITFTTADLQELAKSVLR